MHKIVTHSKSVLTVAEKHGWLIGARYTNLRDIKSFKRVDFIDIDWKNYDFDLHIDAVNRFKPKFTVAKDIESMKELHVVLGQAEALSKYCEHVIVVPKASKLVNNLTKVIPKKFILGYSVPTKYGLTKLPIESFGNRKVHLLGGRPDVQRRIANQLNVFSFDCNRFTLDARFGDYFDGNIFKPHPIGGYKTCIKDSIKNINKIWHNYD